MIWSSFNYKIPKLHQTKLVLSHNMPKKYPTLPNQGFTHVYSSHTTSCVMCWKYKYYKMYSVQPILEHI